MKPVVITLGDLAGIGPDITLKYAATHGLDEAVVVGDSAFLIDRAKKLGFDATLLSETTCRIQDHIIHLHPLPLSNKVQPGEANVALASYYLEALECAVAGCLEGKYRALLTGPLNKALINDAGIPFTGHTEWIANRTGSKQVVMMLLSGHHRVALCTTHLPLRAVADAITADLITDIVKVIHQDLQKYFNITSPRIAVTGLNPHAGDKGHLGKEESEIIEPAIHALQKHYQIEGPFAADTLFQPIFWDRYDAILAMYHDQGLAPIKTLHFGHTVNMTLGLPFVRVSVDHGTAYDKAGTLAADETSFAAALAQLRD